MGPLPGFGQRSSTEWCPSWLTALRRPAPRARRRDGGRGRTGLGLGALESLIFGVEQGLLVFLGAEAVLAGTLTLGMFYAFISFKSHFLSRMMALLQGLGQAFLLPLHAQRLAGALADPVEGGGLALGLRRFAPCG